MEGFGRKHKSMKKKVKIRKWCFIHRVHSPHFYFSTIHLVVIFRDNMLLPLPKHCSVSPVPMLPASLDWRLFLLPGMYFNATALKVDWNEGSSVMWTCLRFGFVHNPTWDCLLSCSMSLPKIFGLQWAFLQSEQTCVTGSSSGSLVWMVN